MARLYLSTLSDLREARTLLRSVSSAASESEQPSLSWALCEHAAPKLVRVVETFVYLLYGFMSDAVEAVIVAQFKSVKSLLQMGYDNFFTPFGGMTFPVAVFSAPLIVPCSFDFPARRIDDTPSHKDRDLFVFNAPVYA
jgi:hypothetical protein